MVQGTPGRRPDLGQYTRSTPLDRDIFDEMADNAKNRF
jgi:hypothetical protein